MKFYQKTIGLSVGDGLIGLLGNSSRLIVKFYQKTTGLSVSDGLIGPF